MRCTSTGKNTRELKVPLPDMQGEVALRLRSTLKIQNPDSFENKRRKCLHPCPNPTWMEKY